MAVHNFLEDEDEGLSSGAVSSETGVRNYPKGYSNGSEAVGSADESDDSPVPNFLQDEDYGDYEGYGIYGKINSDESVDEYPEEDSAEADSNGDYYGGGFSEGVEPSYRDGMDHWSLDSSEDYGEDDEELFDGEDVLNLRGDSSLRSGEALGKFFDPTESADSIVSSKYLLEAESNSVPNFLEDEHEDEEVSLVGRAIAPQLSPSRAEESIAKNGDPIAPISPLAQVEQPIKVRKNLPRRASQPIGEGDSLPSEEPDLPAADPTSDSLSNSPLSPSPRYPTSDSAVEQVDELISTTVSESAQLDSSAAAVSFDPRAGIATPGEDEVSNLKAPSSYAEKRELRFTALRQSDATLRRVGSDGLTVSDRARSNRALEAVGIRNPSNGKLSQEELLFYANLGAQRSSDFGGSSKKQLFIPPMLAEDSAKRAEREARINRALAGGSIARGTKTRLTPKDYRVLQFIAIFKFASERQIAKLLQIAEHSAYKRLNGLRKHGLTKGFKTLGVRGSVWVLTETGMDLSGYELPRGSESALTLSMVSHQFTVNHVAAHLWSGGANVLREKNFPQKNRPDGAGSLNFGEQLVSELQIQSTFGKLRGTTKADAYVPQIKKRMANQFDDWERAGGAQFGPSPELQRGNEFMWTLFPPVSNRLNYHVPDLVVARPRAADGKPQSIAVEVELRTKADDSSYERTLDAYRADDRIYRKVVWICRLKGTAEKLSRIAKRNGLADQGRIAIVPIYLEDGSRFTGRDTWSL